VGVLQCCLLRRPAPAGEEERAVGNSADARASVLQVLRLTFPIPSGRCSSEPRVERPSAARLETRTKECTLHASLRGCNLDSRRSESDDRESRKGGSGAHCVTAVWLSM
jgi:hypothetical protein